MGNHRRRGLVSDAISDLCLLCGKDRETVDQLFVHYIFLFSFWVSFSCEL